MRNVLLLFSLRVVGGLGGVWRVGRSIYVCLFFYVKGWVIMGICCGGFGELDFRCVGVVESYGYCFVCFVMIMLRFVGIKKEFGL